MDTITSRELKQPAIEDVAVGLDTNSASGEYLIPTEKTRQAGHLIVELARNTSALFPQLTDREKTIPNGEYGLLDGNDKPILIEPSKLLIDLNSSSDRDLFPGAKIQGQYTDKDGQYNVISFLYNKLDTNGNLEKDKRVIIMTGIGYGEHPGHPGQPPTWYLVGPQIGTQSHDTSENIKLNQFDKEIPSKNFSIACIIDNPLGEAILANPVQG
jgi:hypothetical protein